LPIRILHTADWHIGQTLNGWPREAEHRAFLAQLGDMIVHHEVDALIIAGDVFDGINPSGDALRMLYSALAGFHQRRPGLTTVMIAGNHDPAGRLEAPEAVLREIGVHVSGTLHRREGRVDMHRHLIPLRDGAGTACAQVLAIPFLRAADLPGLSLADEGVAGSPIVAATARLHAELADAAIAAAGGLPIIATGHLHCAGGTQSEGAERRILIGGEHAVPPETYPDAFAYVALGHLHRPQTLGGGRVRYSGSPFPLSLAEIDYNHGVTLLELDATRLTATHLPLERPVPCLRLPETGTLDPSDLRTALAALALDPALPREVQPFLYLTLSPAQPGPGPLAEVEAILAEHPLRCAGIRIQRPQSAGVAAAPPPSLAETSPEDLFATAFQQLHGTPPDPRHIAAFRDACAGE